LAERLIPAYDHGVRLIDLAPLGDARLVPATLAAALGVEINSDNPLSGVLAALRDRQMLLVLDNCEHVIDAAAGAAAAILASAPEVRILATSREPLRIEGEQLHRLSSLESPPISRSMSAAEALGFSAVELFVERAAANLDEFELNDANAQIIGVICQKLDGIPLAIELAAARVDVLGLQGLAARLEDRLGLLTTGRRTALPRHQTLRATLDWSYNLLPETQRFVLRRLAIFAGDFTREAANVIAASANIGASEVFESVADLVAKSLIMANVDDTPAYYRLLETIRAYAFEKLAESGESDQVARRHARYFRDLFERAEAEVETRPMDEWVAAFRRQIDNLRAALQWVFSPNGDTGLGVALTVASIPLWINLSMMAECRHHVEHALARLNSVAEQDSQSEMQLHAGLGMSLNYTTGPVSATAAAWTKTLEIAQSLGDTEYQLRALRGLWAHQMNGAEYRRALALAQEFRSLAAASADPADLDFGNRMAALMLHYLGDQESASRLLDPRLASPVAPFDHPQTVRFLLDRDVTVQALSSRILWLQGFPDQATRAARSAVDRALAIGHGLSLCHALAQAACPVAQFTGDLAWAESSVAMLLDNAKERGLAGWIARGHCFLGMVMIAREDFAAGLPLLRDALVELRESGAAPGYPAFLAVLAGGLGRAGQVIEGLAVVDQALALSKGHEEHWCLPELLRTEGELHLREGAGETALAKAAICFREALEWAQRGRVPAWELRAVTSLARLWQAQDRRDARDLLRPVYARFNEGFDTADLQTAKRLLDELG
jgi:predicted ATPase